MAELNIYTRGGNRYTPKDVWAFGGGVYGPPDHRLARFTGCAPDKYGSFEKPTLYTTDPITVEQAIARGLVKRSIASLTNYRRPLDPPA